MSWRQANQFVPDRKTLNEWYSKNANEPITRTRARSLKQMRWFWYNQKKLFS